MKVKIGETAHWTLEQARYAIMRTVTPNNKFYGPVEHLEVYEGERPPNAPVFMDLESKRHTMAPALDMSANYWRAWTKNSQKRHE